MMWARQILTNIQQKYLFKVLQSICKTCPQRLARSRVGRFRTQWKCATAQYTAIATRLGGAIWKMHLFNWWNVFFQFIGCISSSCTMYLWNGQTMAGRALRAPRAILGWPAAIHVITTCALEYPNFLSLCLICLSVCYLTTGISMICSALSFTR